MGVLNVTPDSFSDGGKYYQMDDAIDRAIELEKQGADILDIVWVLGGCSLIRPLPLNPEPPFLGLPQTQSLDLPVMLLLMALMIIFGFSEGKLRRWQGGVLFAIYISYLVALFTLIRP